MSPIVNTGIQERFRAAFLVVCMLTAATASAQVLPDVDALVQEGKDAMYRLEYESAEKAFERLIESYPEHAVGYGMMSILRWNQLLAAASNFTLHPYGTPNPYSGSQVHKPTESESQRFHDAIEQLISICEGILEREPENVTALYFKGLAHENLAAEAIAVSRNRTGAIGPGREANRIHKRVLELDPGFVDANVSVATYKFALATLPFVVKALLSPGRLFGFFSGSKEEAFEMMERVGREGMYRDLDARVVLAIMHAFKGDPARSVSILRELGQQYPENFMIDLNLAAVQEFRLKDPRAALDTYDALERALPRKTPGLGAGEVRFRIGMVHFGMDELVLARSSLERVAELPTVEAETVPLSHFYLAQIHESMDEKDVAAEFYRQAVADTEGMPSLEEELAFAKRKLR